METASANPFVSQNGSDVYCGNGQHRSYDDDEDFGPETDVDMVDDVLLSPAIAAAKALVHGKKDIEDDLERQRQQLSDFDDPADIDRSRDTPTPPAHEVANSANVDNLAESGGEESEEEWNYIPGKDPKPDSADTQDQDDMSSQLNPNAAEFVPVSPTRLLMQDDAIISASPCLGFDKSLDNVQLPSELEFCSEIAQRPGDLEIANGRKRGDDYFMRDNFSTLRNKEKDFNVSSTCAELVDDSIISLNSSVNNLGASASENIPFDKLEAVQVMDNKENISQEESIFRTNNEFSNNAFGAISTFGKNDPMTTSIMGLKSFASSPESEDHVIPDTPKSTAVEAPISPINDDVLPLNHQTDLDSPADDYLINTQKSPEMFSPGDGPQDGITSGQERTSSSGFESESGAEEGETNVPGEGNQGFITENRRSPPMDLSFKPIQTFSDTNPFGALETPASTTPLDQFNINAEHIESQIETPKKHTEDKPAVDNMAFLQNTPSSFISLRRSPTEDIPVPFEELESPKDVPHFEYPPNANSSMLTSELPKSPEPQNNFEDVLSCIKQEPLESVFSNQSSDELNINDVTQNLFPDETNPTFEETSFITEDSPNKELKSHQNLDTTAGFIVEESKILQDEQECEQTSKLKEEVMVDISQVSHPAEDDLDFCDISPKAVEQVLAAFDDIKDDHETESKGESHEESKEFDFEFETKVMKLEFESHITNSEPSPEDLKHLDGFEVINKEEFTLEVDTSNLNNELEESELNVDFKETTKPQEDVHQLSPSKQTNPFINDDNVSTTEPVETKEESPITTHVSVDNNLLSAIENFNSALTENITSEELTPLSSPLEILSPLEPQATKTVSYQTLTPADEPKLTKSETYITGIKDEAPTKSSVMEETISEITKVEESCILQEESISEVASAPVDPKLLFLDEPVLTKSEPVQSQVVTETLITALEETSEVPSVTTTEVPSTAGTPPPTPAPGLDNKDDSQKTDMLVAAVAAAGAVAAGSAIVAEKEMKNAVTAPAKKPMDVAPKKAPNASAKTNKAPPLKGAPTKPAVPKTTTAIKPPVTATKSSTMTSAPKPVGPTKPVVGHSALKKTAPTVKSVPSKPAGTTTVPKPPGPTQKSVPKQLPVNKTSTAKPASKPTTPTTPKAPMKSDGVKPPQRPGGAKPALLTTKSSGVTSKPTTGDESSEKKPATINKTSLTTKTTAPTAKTAPMVKTSVSAATKSATSGTKSAAPIQPKPKVLPPTTNNTTKPVPAPIKRPLSSVGAITKTADKPGKETVNKQISNTKSVVNGKPAPAKTISGIKKTDAKVNGKNPTGKPAPIRKPEEMKKEDEKVKQIQEDNVTTTNGFTEHIIGESMKIEELVAPVIVDGVN